MADDLDYPTTHLITSLAVESWILYALSVIIVAARTISRRIRLGKWRALMAIFTGVVFAVNEVAKNGSNYMPGGQVAALSPAGVRKAIYGSMMAFVLEILTLTAIWTIKACLLILYDRLTRDTEVTQHMLVKFTAVYSLVTYLLMLSLFILYWCSPISGYWAVPAKFTQCATHYHHMIFATVCNISSDILLLLIPIPIILRSHFPTKRKIILCCILGLGVFNILITILNRYYNFSVPHSYIFLVWYVAEVGTAIIVGNLPLCWPILRLLLGYKDETRMPSYRGHAVSRAGRRKRPRNPLSLGTTLRGSRQDTLHDIEGGCAASEASQTQRAGSGHGSQIQLVLQEHKHDGSVDEQDEAQAPQPAEGGSHVPSPGGNCN